MTTRLGTMETLQEATLTLAEAARRLGTTVDGLLAEIYDGALPATPQRSSGRLLVAVKDVERLRVSDGD